ncbi:Demethylmenaquinone methyltransferase [Phycisphaerae bacterium RAS1]|nr:Demethylmenaquinone methyltransferase [Phycisphaerae bacterium RAS1]
MSDGDFSFRAGSIRVPPVRIGGTPMVPENETLTDMPQPAAKDSARRQFDHWAHSYDRSWLNELVFFPSIRICMEEIARWKSRRGSTRYRLLDVGCGTASLITLLARDSAAERLVGLDFSAAMVGRAAEKIAADGADKLHVVNGDAERLPFADGAFDIVTCCNSFHHYPQQRAAVREFHRVLRPGGRLILVDGFRDNVIGWFVFDVGVTLAEGQVHHASWSALRGMIEQAGFAGLRQRKLNVFAPLLVNIADR